MKVFVPTNRNISQEESLQSGYFVQFSDQNSNILLILLFTTAQKKHCTFPLVKKRSNRPSNLLIPFLALLNSVFSYIR